MRREVRVHGRSELGRGAVGAEDLLADEFDLAQGEHPAAAVTLLAAFRRCAGIHHMREEGLERGPAALSAHLMVGC